MAEDHLVVKLAVDPSFDQALDITEITYHVSFV